MTAKAIAFLLAALLLVTSCSQTMEPLPADVNVIVDIKEYTMTLNAASGKSGVVKFGVRNLGTMVHDFDLYKSDLALDKLPIDSGSAKVKMDGLVKQMINIAANRSTTLSADLGPGRYVIICNVAGHYQLGMKTELKVE